MQLQEQKVFLTQRFNPFKGCKDKEWWYTGISDEKQKLFIGISVIRTKLIDSIDISVYFSDGVDKDNKVNVNVEKNSGGHWEQAAFMGWIKCGDEKDKLDLSVNRGRPEDKFYFDYTDEQGGREQSDSCKNKWRLEFSSNKKNLKIKGSFEIGRAHV